MRQKFLLSLALFIAVSSATVTSYASVLPPVNPGVVAPSSKEPEVVGVANAAVDEFKSLSKKDRKVRLKAAKKEFKQYKKEKRAGHEPSTNTLLLVILAILFLLYF